MKEKRYILMTIEKSNYDGYARYFYRLFETYRELQKHLLKFQSMPSYIVFEETNIKKDKAFKMSDRNYGSDFYE